MTLRKSLRWTAGAAALALVASGCSFITRVSVASDGTQGNAGSGSAGQPHLTGNSRYSLFSSGATNLVANDTNGKIDAFRHDDTTGVTRRVSLDGLGQQINADSGAVGISDDGATVVFATTAALTAEDQNTSFDLYVKNVATGDVALASLRPDGSQLPAGHSAAEAVLSANGRYLAFYDSEFDTSTGLTDQILVRDLVAGSTYPLGTKAFKSGLTISGDGQHVADARTVTRPATPRRSSRCSTGRARRTPTSLRMRA